MPLATGPSGGAPGEDALVVQVWDRNGVQVFLSQPQHMLPRHAQPGFDTIATSAGEWRVFSTFADGQGVQVAQPMRVRRELAASMALRTIVPLLTVLVPYLGLRATLSMTLPCVMALGRTQLLFWVSLIYAFVHLPAFIAATALFGLTGAIWSIVVAGVFYSYLNAWMLRATVGISLAEILSQLRRPLVATALMVSAVVALGAVTPVGRVLESASWTSLLIKTLVGGVVFCSSQYALWRLQGRPAGIERRVVQLMSH